MSQQQFNDADHTMVQSNDGSFTAYSKVYDEHYHSTKDGALQESLNKHVVPCFSHLSKRSEITILDICFGLGFNTLATLYYVTQHKMDVKLRIYAPELDADLVRSLEYFSYPKEFKPFISIIKSLAQTHRYEDEQFYIEVFVGDARDFVRDSNQKFDIVYQDAFSPSVNPVLWTKEYFNDIAKLMKKEALLSTYSTALAVRLALYENKFNLYLYEAEGCRTSTLASLSSLALLQPVDMAHKISCNPDKKPLSDKEL